MTDLKPLTIFERIELAYLKTRRAIGRHVEQYEAKHGITRKPADVQQAPPSATPETQSET